MQTPGHLCSPPYMPYTYIYIDDRDAVSRTREEAPSLIDRAACAGVEMLKFGSGRQTVLVRSEGGRSTIRGRGSHERVLKSLSSGPGGKQSTLVKLGMEVDPHRLDRRCESLHRVDHRYIRARSSSYFHSRLFFSRHSGCQLPTGAAACHMH
jgi:hypothetical protein